MQYRNRTIELVAPAGLATMIDEYAILGPELGDRLPSFLGVSLPEHLVEIAFDEGVCSVRHSALAYFLVNHHEEARGMRRAVPRRIRLAAPKALKCRPLSIRSA